MKVVKKKHRDSEERYAREISKVWAEYVERIEDRHAWAVKVFANNDQVTNQAVEDMMEIMTRMAYHPDKPRVMIRIPRETGDGWHEFPKDVPAELHEQTLYFCCASICMSLYGWGIRFANFKPPKKNRDIPWRQGEQ